MNGLRGLILGAGYSGRAIGRLLASKGARVTGTSRSEDKAALLPADGISPLLHAQGIAPEVRSSLLEATHLIVSIPPGEAGDQVLRDLRESGIERLPQLRGIIYLSTVGVYGDHGGDWVDEESECRPVTRRSIQRLEVEAEWQAFAQAAGVPLTIFRLAGIYGPGRNAFVNLRNGTAKRVIRPGQVFNRIHVDDIAAAAAHFIATGLSGIFNGADDEPSPPQEVVDYAADLMGVQPPPAIEFDDADMTPMARTFYEECKRVSNRKLTTSGYRFIFPTYREALKVMWDTGRW